MVKVLIIYNSKQETQNTKKIALAVANAIKADVASVEECNKYQIENYDLVGFGSGIYFNKVGKNLTTYVESLQAKQQPCFVFYTSGAKQCQKAIDKFIKLLQTKNRNCLGIWHCLGRDVAFTLFKKNGGFNKDRPNQQDCQQAIEFVQSLISKI